MPPRNQKQLSREQRRTLTRWVSAAIKTAVEARRKTDGRVVMRRLNRVEYRNTMFDLLGLDMDYDRDLPPDAVSADGFLNNGRSLRISAIQIEYFLQTARRALGRIIVTGPAPKVYHHEFKQGNVKRWLGRAERSNRLGRQQEFLAKMRKEYPERGQFVVRVKLTADLKPNTGYPLLEVSVGYQPDTFILLREFELVEVTSAKEQTFEFRGRIETFPLPVRGQGKFPGLVVRVRNKYDDGSPRPKSKKGKKGRNRSQVYPVEDHLPSLTIKSVEFHGPVFDQWPPASHRRILFDSPLRKTDEKAYVAKVLERFMTRAYRRPVTRAEVNTMAEFYKSIRSGFPTLEDAMRETLAMVLIRPEFLYLLEPAGREKRPVNDWELASRLSYFLWSTMPDQRLMDLAARKTLHQPKVLAAEVERMLADRRSSRFVEQFTNQWLRLNVLDSVAVSREYHPRFDERLKQDMRSETQHFFGELLRKNESALNLISSKFTMLNEPLAKHYGVKNVYGRRFRRVALKSEQHRGGLLGHASILLSNSTGFDSHPVRRAVWIRDRLLNDKPAPPPPDVPTLDEADAKFHKLSVREQLVIHRNREACASCHRNIDPWGIALENFDAVGLWRDEVRRKRGRKFEKIRVIAKDTLPNGRELDGVDQLKEYLMTKKKGEFAKSLISRLMTYALGRRLELGDRKAIDELAGKFAADQYRMRSSPQAMWRWFPDGEGKDYKFTETLKPLAPHRKDLTVLGGLSHPNGRKMGGHDTGDTFLTATLLNNKFLRNTVSVDQIAAQALSDQTRFSSLVLSTDGGVGEPTRSSTLSYNDKGRPIPALNQPQQIFDRFFGTGDAGSAAERRRLLSSRRMLDRVLEDSRSLRRRLGVQDREKLDEYLASVRQIEKRVERSQRWLEIPRPELRDEERDMLHLESDDKKPLLFIRTMYDLIYLAFRTDSTRVATYQITNMADASSKAGKFPQLQGFKMHLHSLAHAWNKPDGAAKLGKWDRFMAQQLAYFLKRMSSAQEPDGTLLDNTIVLYGSSNSTTHNNNNYPLIVAGGKLDAMQDILEGLTTDDLKKVRGGADRLRVMSMRTEWNVDKSAAYRRLSATFRRSAETLGTAARKNRPDSAALSNLRVTKHLSWMSNFQRLPMLAVATLVVGLFASATARGDETATRCVSLELYVCSDDAKSLNAEKTLKKFVGEKQGLKLRTFHIEEKKPHLARFQRILKYFGLKEAKTPVVYCCSYLMTDLDDPARLRRQVEAALTVSAYVREGCPRCAAAKSFLGRLKRRYPGITVAYFDVIEDRKSLARMQALAKRYRKAAASLPAIHLCNSLSIGYIDDETTGQRLDSKLRYWTLPCSPPAIKKKTSFVAPAGKKSAGLTPRELPALYFASISEFCGEAPLENAPTNPLPPGTGVPPDSPLPPGDGSIAPGPPPAGDLPPIPPEADGPMSESSRKRAPPAVDEQDSVQVPVFGKLSLSQLGMPAFTFLIGLVDGFNPCAMWVLLFLLSVLVNLKSRAKILAVAGTFVIISGVAYFAFMAAWLNIFMFVGYLRWVQITLGVTAVIIGAVHIKDFFAFKKGISFSIPESFKPGIYARVRKIVTAQGLLAAVLGATVLAVLVNIVELLCTAGLPALYTEILTLQEYPPWKNYAYLGLYNAAYMLDDFIMVGIVVVTLGRHKLQERGGRWLKFLSGAAIATLGLVMIIKPDWLV
eukprot:g10213.t1